MGIKVFPPRVSFQRVRFNFDSTALDTKGKKSVADDVLFVAIRPLTEHFFNAVR